MAHGKVTFVGVGSGDPRLWTARAVDRMAEADVTLARTHATVEQVIAAAQAGRHVARPLDGDGFENEEQLGELMAVAAAGIRFEVVPGVSWRGVAGAFAGLLGPACVVPAGEVAASLASWAAGSAVTLVASPASPSQRLVVTTKEDAPARAALLGEASVLVALGVPNPALAWFQRQPLFGKRVLVTRAREQAGSMAALLRERGAEVRVLPTISIEPPSDPAPLVRALVLLRQGAYGWVVFTSANGVDRVWTALAEAGADARAFGACKLAAIGPATAAALVRCGLRPDVVAKEFRGEILAEAIVDALNAAEDAEARPRVLLARAMRARDVVPEALRAAGCEVDVVSAYETHPASADSARSLASSLEAGELDVLTFTSSSTVENFCDLLGDRAPELAARARVASIGPVTTETAIARGLRVDVTAREYTVQGLVEALAESYG